MYNSLLLYMVNGNRNDLFCFFQFANQLKDEENFDVINQQLSLTGYTVYYKNFLPSL